MKNGALWALLGVGGLLAFAASSGTAEASTNDPYAVPPGGGSNPRIVWSTALPDGGRVELWDEAGYQVVVATDAAGNTVFTGSVADFERWSNARYPGGTGGGTGGGGSTYVPPPPVTPGTGGGGGNTPPPPAPGGGTGRDEVTHTAPLVGGVTAYQMRLRDGSEWWAVLNQSDGRQIFGGSRAEYERWLSSWIAQHNTGGGSTGGGSTGGGSTGGGGASYSSEPHDRDTVEAYQRVLRGLRYQIDADGVIGPATRSALRAFQGAANREQGWHLTVDGVLGPNTRNGLAWYLGRGYFDAPDNPVRGSRLQQLIYNSSSTVGINGLEGLGRRF